jgi:hypothetical protein
MKRKAALTYRVEWTELVEVEIPDGATKDLAKSMLHRAAERHRPAGPPRSYLSPADLTHERWAGDEEEVG